jgi:hypothetical protein
VRDAGTDSLGRALLAEYAAIYGYGVAGAHLDKANLDAAHQAESAHRSRRDTLLVRLARQNATPPAAPAAYALPFPVTDRTSALKLAVELEDGTARSWHDVLGATTGDDRSLALSSLTDCAVRATRWRRAASMSPLTLAFPGTTP